MLHINTYIHTYITKISIVPQILIYQDCVNLFRIRCNGQTETTFSNKNSGIRFSEDDGDERRKLLLFVLLLYSWVFPFIHILLTDRVVEWGTCTKRKKFFRRDTKGLYFLWYHYHYYIVENYLPCFVSELWNKQIYIFFSAMIMMKRLLIIRISTGKV